MFNTVKCCKHVFFLIIMFLQIVICAVTSYSEDSPVKIVYFYQPGCKECDYVNTFILPDLQERYKNVFSLEKYDTNIKENFLKLVGLQEKFNITANEPVFIFIDETYALCGLADIKENINLCMEKALNANASNSRAGDLHKNDKKLRDSEEVLFARGEKMALPTIISAGILDGINPCVFSTLIFFISLLSVMKTSLHKIIIIGTTYCFSCFVSYFLLGFGIFKIIRLFNNFSAIQYTIDIFTALILSILAVLSFIDAWNYRKNKDSSQVLLQIPDSLKLKIHSIMKRGLNYRFIIPGTFAVGLFVTIIESVCTGQLYLPTLVYLAKESDKTFKWMSFLFIYNIMYILPLLVIFIFFISGIKIKSFLFAGKRNIVPIKIITGLFFIFLAIVILK